MPNTLMIQVSDAQYDTLVELLGYALTNMDFDLQELSEKNEGARTNLAEFIALAEDLEDTIEKTKSYLWESGCGLLKLEIADRHIDAIARPGDNEPATLAAVLEDGYLAAQLMNLTDKDVAEYLKDAGINEVDSKSRADQRKYVLWMACHDIQEEKYNDD